MESLFPRWIFLMISGRTEWPRGQGKGCSHSRTRPLTRCRTAFPLIRCTAEFLQRLLGLACLSDSWMPPEQTQIHSEVFQQEFIFINSSHTKFMILAQRKVIFSEERKFYLQYMTWDGDNSGWCPWNLPFPKWRWAGGTGYTNTKQMVGSWLFCGITTISKWLPPLG